MQTLIREYEKSYLKDPRAIPDIRPGDTVRVSINIYEGGTDHIAGLKKIHRIAAKGKEKKSTAVERVQVFEGTIIAIKGHGSRQKFCVRKLASGVGVEKTYFVHSRKIEKIEIVRRAKTRRAKLYFLRDRIGKATRLREKRLFGKLVSEKPEEIVEEPQVEVQPEPEVEAVAAAPEAVETAVEAPVEDPVVEAPAEEAVAEGKSVAEAEAGETPVAEESTEKEPSE